jgi:formate dehydrogenase (NADP+) beta subunit
MVDALVNVVPTPSRAIKPVLPVEERIFSFREVEGTINEDQCRQEATRCLNCGIYCYDQDDLPAGQIRLAKSYPNEPQIVEKEESVAA